MTISPASTGSATTSQYGIRTVRPFCAVLHHGATTSDDQIIAMMVTGSRVVSAHQVVKDKRRTAVVPEEYRAFSLSSQYWDSAAFTVECANESTAGWTISPESHESLAILVADWATRYGFWPHRDGAPETWTVLGHREVYTIHGASYATACPGGMDLDWVTKRAQETMLGINEGDDVPLQIKIGDGLGKYGPKNQLYWTVVGTGKISSDRALADKVSVVLDRPWKDVDYATWEYLTGGPQVTIDAAAAKLIADQLKGVLKFPTLEEIDALDNDEIAAILAAIAAIKAGDTAGIQAAIERVPAATVAAFKAAL
jgi:hypothetical protein